MRGYLCYAGMELKRALKRLPHILAGAAVLVVLMGAAALLAGKLLYGGQAVERIPVGVVLPEEDALAGQAMRMVSSLESVKSLCDFTYIEEEATGEKLKKGELFAVLKMPDGFIQDIMSGVNTPVTVILPENAGAESRIFKELTDAGAEILGSAQAGIYSGDELLSEYGFTDKMAVFERDMNQIYLTYSLPRMDYFRKVMVNAAKDVSVPVFYGISAFVLVLLLSVISVSDLFKERACCYEAEAVSDGDRTFYDGGKPHFGSIGAFERDFRSGCCGSCLDRNDFHWIKYDSYRISCLSGGGIL